MRYFINPENEQVYGFDDSDEGQRRFMQLRAIDKSWKDITGSWPPEATEEELASAVREKRDKLISDADAMIMTYREQKELLDDGVDLIPKYTKEQYKAILIHKQKLREITEQEGFPREVVWSKLDIQ